jgi:uncharacterized protein (TIGR03435 family)
MRVAAGVASGALRRIFQGMGIGRRAVTVLGLTALVTVVSAQSEPRFTVASIRPSADNEPGMSARPLPNGGYSARKAPLIALLTSAYGLSPERVINAPAWPDRYDIEARYQPGDPAEPVPPLTTLLQSLLRDRFGLVARMEQRDLPVYVLKLARADGRPGPQLRRSNRDCANAAVTLAAEVRDLASNGAPACGANEGPGIFVAGGLTMGTIARALRVPANRNVVDATGLDGLWEAKLEFAAQGDESGNKPSIFTALQDQLGLKLEPSTAPLDVLVIDAIQRPTPN